MSVPCREPGCGHEWDRDPVLEVACPECDAPVGVKCASVAPSGHRKSTTFSKLPPWGHDRRDLLAAAEGHYLHDCTLPEEEMEARTQRAAGKLGRAVARPTAKQEELAL